MAVTTNDMDRLVVGFDFGTTFSGQVTLPGLYMTLVHALTSN